MSGMQLETCWAFSERWNNKFCCKVASCWLFLVRLNVFYRNRTSGSFVLDSLVWNCNYVKTLVSIEHMHAMFWLNSILFVPLMWIFIYNKVWYVQMNAADVQCTVLPVCLLCISWLETVANSGLFCWWDHFFFFNGCNYLAGWRVSR